MNNIIATAKTYKNPRTGQEFQNATLKTVDFFISEKQIIINFQLFAEGGLDETFKYFWNEQKSEGISVLRYNDKLERNESIVLESLKDILETDIVQSYGKFDLIGFNNNHEFDGQIPWKFTPTTDLAWKQLFHNITFNGESISKQFSYETKLP